MNVSEKSKLTSEDLVEESVFSRSQFLEMYEWLNLRKSFEIDCQITGIWADTNQFFKGNGKILKRYDGKFFQEALYVLLSEADIGKEDILIGRRILEVRSNRPIQAYQNIADLRLSLDMKTFPEAIEPTVFVLENAYKKDLQHQIFFRSREFERAITFLASYIKRYEVTALIDGMLITSTRQIPCIITGVVKSVGKQEIYISVWDAFDPSDPLNDETKEWLMRNWTIEIAQIGVNKVHPRFMVFETGEELALSRNVLMVNDLSVTLGGNTIINHVNFQIQRGEILGIIGESGSGKSTTLKAILGEFDYAGHIQVFGIDAHDTKAIAPFIGYVPQDLSRMYGNFNCLENIVSFGRQFGIPDEILIQRGKKIIADLGIENVANQPIESLSGGQKRRASIAIAMVHNPFLLFLDEPTSGLDPLARYELWEYLDLINKEYGITLCVISHYLDEIEYCDKACIFLRGIGFFDFNTPDGLRKTLPGQGIAIEVTLEQVDIEAVNIIQNIEGVVFVIQRGERIRILSNESTSILRDRILQALEKSQLKVHNIVYKVSVDMIDYFTYVSVQHQRHGSGQLGHQSVQELQHLIKEQQNLNEPAIGYGKEMEEKIRVYPDAEVITEPLTNKKESQKEKPKEEKTE